VGTAGSIGLGAGAYDDGFLVTGVGRVCGGAVSRVDGSDNDDGGGSDGIS
jgi:hypothetical protein